MGLRDLKNAFKRMDIHHGQNVLSNKHEASLNNQEQPKQHNQYGGSIDGEDIFKHPIATGEPHRCLNGKT